MQTRSQVECPEERSFELDLRKYVPQNRSRLVRAGLTILRAYYIAGKPKQKIKQFGRFEEWGAWIRSAIVWIGMADPCESRKDIENSDPVRILLRSLFTVWYEILRDQPIKIKELEDVAFISVENNDADTIEKKEILRDVLLELASDRKGSINRRRLAKQLALYKNRIENGFRLEQKGSYQGTFLWCIRQVKK